MKNSKILIGAALLVTMAVACAPEADEASVEQSPRPAVSDSPSPDVGDVSFDPAMVRTESVTKENKGGQTNIRFVANTNSYDDIVSLTNQCVDYYLDETVAAYCYGYGSQEDFDLTAFDWTPASDDEIFGSGRPCWVMYSGQPIAGPEGRTESPASATSYIDQCPGNVEFPDPDGSLADYRAKREGSLAQSTQLRQRDACALVDEDALARNGFNTVLGDVTGDPTAYLTDGAIAAWVCSTAESEVGFTVTEFATAEAAAADALSDELATNDFLLNSGQLLTIDGGNAIVNSELGIAQATWSTGTTSVRVMMSSMPVIPGVPGGQTQAQLADAVTALASAANSRIASDAW
ncbi:hypothetical protein [Rhodococcoides fascians]|uniref:hypothetical protein n=1 Tax=Rhodococcoides fascians TaxID=1828 RepID=UPI0012D3357A|nr:hypothetical protein [Rhodococcus fascians]